MARLTDEMTSLMPPTATTAAAGKGIEWDDAPGNASSDITEMLSKRLAIDILVKLPIVVVPVSSRSTSAVIVDLGGLSVINELRVVPDVVSDGDVPAVVDWTNFHWSSVSVTR